MDATPPDGQPLGPCGARFSAMLRCVEVSGSSAACTREIDAFLDCERAVFRALQRAVSSHAASRDGASKSDDVGRLRSLPVLARAPDPPPDRELLGVVDRGKALWHGVARAAQTQAAACKKLLDMCAQEGMVTKLQERCVCIAREGVVSVSIVAKAVARGAGNASAKVRQSVEEWKSSSSSNEKEK